MAFSHWIRIYLYRASGKEGNRSLRVHEWSRTMYKIGKPEVPIILWQGLLGAAAEGGAQDERGRAELGPPLLLTIWKRPNLYFVYLTV